MLATGSAGGFVIIQYVVKSLVGALDWGLDPQQAVSMIDFGAANSPTTYVGGEHPDVDASDNGAHDPLVVGLRRLGHTVSVVPQSSGLTMLRRTTAAREAGLERRRRPASRRGRGRRRDRRVDGRPIVSTVARRASATRETALSRDRRNPARQVVSCTSPSQPPSRMRDPTSDAARFRDATTPAEGHRSTDRAERTTVGRWARECLAGATGGLATLASVLTLGLLANTALGPQAAVEGIPASFIATVVGGSLFTLLGRGPMPAGGPSSAPTLILAALVLDIAGDAGFDRGQSRDVAALLALTAASIVGMGLLQVAFALGGMTRAAKFIPQPVLAGFMNGVAIVFVTAQVPTLLGWSSGTWTRERWGALGQIQPATLAIGVCTVAAIWAWPLLLRWPRLPSFARVFPGAFVGLVVGCAAYAIVAIAWPGAPLGGVVGPVPPAWPAFDRLAPLLGGDATGLIHRHAGQALTTAILMALIGTLDIVLNGLALDQALETRTDPRRELIALGAANVLSGAAGGLPLLLIRARALGTWRAGGRTKVSLLFGNALFALLALAGTPLLAPLPKVVLGGIMIMIGLLLIDSWSIRLAGRWLRQSPSRETRLNLALVAIVCVASVAWGFAIGVAIGGGLAVALFIRSMNRSLIRSRRNADEQPSRRIYSTEHEAVLETVRPSIVILELEGALFFGSGERLLREVDRMGAGYRAVVIDLHRVGHIDPSGAIVLSQVRRLLEERGVALLLAGVAPHDARGRGLVEFAGDGLPATAWHPDVDRAVEEAELRALAETTTIPLDAAVPLSGSDLMKGLDAAQRARLAARLEQTTLEAGERLFSQGDAGDRLYVLTTGSVSVLGGPERTPEPDGPAPRVRYVTCSPGMMFGEVAMLDHRGRSAEAVADTASEVHALSAPALEALSVEDPVLATHVFRNIAVHLSARLRIASKAQLAGQRAATHERLD